MTQKTAYKYCSRERPVQSYDLFYYCLGGHDEVDNFMFAFHGIGCGEFTHLEGKKGYDTVLDIYNFWRKTNSLSKRQISFAASLLSDLGEL